MKKAISLILSICLTLALTAGPAYAASSSLTNAQQVVQALGIIVGDGTGNMNLSANVTRAQFAKMMIAASTYKDTISTTSKSSPFKDVKYTNWAASYVQAAVTAGWLTGYTDGTYRPDNNVKLEEAASAVLKMLGYTTNDFTGSFPEAQIAKYAALGLNTNISAVQGQVLTRQDCVYLFYNLMSTKNKSGSYYATTLGYTVNSYGEIDFSSLVLNNMKGPFIVEDSTWSASLPFTASAATVYINGVASTISAVSNYDVYYYNAGMSTIWAYSNNVTGVYTAASPSTSAPTSVTVAGKSYTISSATAAFALSNLGSFQLGDTVTLLIGMNGDVVGVASPAEINTTKYGLITATGKSSYTDSSGNSYTAYTMTVACTDGNSYVYQYSGYDVDNGTLVQISYSNGTMEISKISEKTMYGTVNAAGTTLGSYAFSSDVQIMDSTSNGSFIRIYPSRLAGMTLYTDDVRYYVLDSNGKISRLILDDVTGDMYDFGILTSVSESVAQSSNSYKYIVDGSSASFSSSTTFFGATAGPVQIELCDSSIVSMKNLTSMLLTSLNSGYATSGGVQYALADVSVYLYKNSSYTLTTIAAVSDTSSYTLYGYYDKTLSEGGRVRVIVAYAK